MPHLLPSLIRPTIKTRRTQQYKQKSCPSNRTANKFEDETIHNNVTDSNQNNGPATALNNTGPSKRAGSKGEMIPKNEIICI